MKKKVMALVAISMLMIIVMIYIADPNKMANIMAKTDFVLIALVIALYIANGFVKALRWHILVHSSGGEASYSRLYLFLLIGLMVNNTTPGRIGGEPVRAYLLRSRDDVPMGQGLSTIFMERIIDLIVLTSMALIGIAIIIPLLLTSDIGIEPFILSFVPVIVIIVLAIYVASHPKFLKNIALGMFALLKKISKGEWLQKAEGKMISFTDSFSAGLDNMKNDLSRKKRNGAAFVALTLLIWLNEAGRIYLIFLALPDIEAPSFGAVLIATSLATVFGVALPIGAMHATLIATVFAALGVDPASATTAGILTIMTSIWLSIPLGIVAMFVVGLKVGKKSDEIVEEDSKAEKDLPSPVKETEE